MKKIELTIIIAGVLMYYIGCFYLILKYIVFLTLSCFFISLDII